MTQENLIAFIQEHDPAVTLETILRAQRALSEVGRTHPLGYIDYERWYPAFVAAGGPPDQGRDVFTRLLWSDERVYTRGGLYAGLHGPLLWEYASVREAEDSGAHVRGTTVALRAYLKSTSPESVHAAYRLVSQTPQQVTIRDVGGDKRPSVTNDAEYVVFRLHALGLLPEGQRLIYSDSEGRLDEISHDGQGHFTGFLPGAT